MFLSNRDIKWAIECGKLIVNPAPDLEQDGYDETSIDLHLGPIESARIWSPEALQAADKTRGISRHGGAPEVGIGQFDWEAFAPQHQIEIPAEDSDEKKASQQLACRRGNEVIVRRFGFLLWPTREIVGTPKAPADPADSTKRHPELICFVNAKSTRARTGLLVHFTAPTIHAGWAGNIILEVANLGPFTFVLKAGDAIAQLTVATISSAPDYALRKKRSLTQGQADPTGRPLTKR